MRAKNGQFKKGHVPLNKTHGRSHSPIYLVWNAMRSRCTNPNVRTYEHYGARGITVSPEWRTFEGFCKDMCASYRAGLSLERINNDKGYSKSNCRWATWSEQMNNRRTKCKAIAPEIRSLYRQGQTQKQIAQHFKISQSSVSLIVNNNHYVQN